MVGVGLSAACGFRVFIPPLVIAIASKAGHITLGADFAWMGTDIALVSFGLAAVLEVGAYYIPWLDNALDAIAAPVAVVAGTLTSAAVLAIVIPILVFSMVVLFIAVLIWKNPIKLYRNWRARKDRQRKPPLLAAS